MDIYPSLITNQKFSYTFHNFSLICKTGSSCLFDINQLSNHLHTHSSFELCIILEGSGKFTVADATFKLRPGDIILSEPYQYHKVGCNPYSELHLIYFFIDIKHHSIPYSHNSIEDNILLHFLKHHIPISHNTSKIMSYHSFINNYCKNISHIDYSLSELLKLLILESLIALSASQPATTANLLPVTTLERAQDYIDMHLHEKIYIQDIALHCSVSPRTLQYTFQKELHTSISDYIIEHKIKLACHYLLNKFSIIDTAHLVGITNLSYFNKCFKKIMGLTPGQVRKLDNPFNNLGRRL